MGVCVEASAVAAAASLEGVSEAADLEAASVEVSQDKRVLAGTSLTKIFMPIILDQTSRLPAGCVWTDTAVVMVERTPAMT